MEIVFDEEEQDDYETEIIDGILTFDELLQDDYYKSEFEKRVQQRLDIQTSHSDVKGGTNLMNGQVQQQIAKGEIMQGETSAIVESQVTPKTTENPSVEPTNTAQQGKTNEAQEPTREMTAQQFEQYNEALRSISKSAKRGLPDRYNAFEDAEVKAAVKATVMNGDTPDIKELAASVVTRLTHKEETTEPSPSTDNKEAQDTANVIELKAENALLRAGIQPERIEAAKKLFIAEGAHFDKVSDFVAQYPEWGASSGRVVLGKAQPLADKTAPTPNNPPVLNDFERKVREARKKAGLE